ncbi:MAG: acyltransferase [Cellvibrio sp.]|uniref:acyltransferase n=1 Tax=Cellvibrio sp. TaxID=1965322 RepID=UPI002719C322|nr:acyltransferase [Cellvibrio sp.]
MSDQNTERYRQQHKLRLSYMPWLYASLKPAHRSWAQAWQDEWQAYLVAMETVVIGKNCFIAPEARLFAEPGRAIVLGDNSYIAADCVLHGPITLGEGVSINHHVSMDGGSKGIVIGDNTRIAAYSYAYAFNHGMDGDRLISDQAVTSKGIQIGCDVWIGANTGIVDGITIGDHAVVGMGSIVTKSVTAYAKIAGNPAVPIGTRAARDETAPHSTPNLNNKTDQEFLAP